MKDHYQTFELKKKSELISCTNNLSKFRPTCWNFIVKKNFIKKNNIKFKEILTAEDWVFVSELLCLCKKFYLIPFQGSILNLEIFRCWDHSRNHSREYL